MDYKYIEILIERYFNCETTLEEERILKAFFHQEEVPDALRQYANIFAFEAADRNNALHQLDDNFDQRVLDRLDDDHDAPVKYVRIQRLTFNDRIRPLMHAAAAVAIVALIGGSIHQAYLRGSYNPIGGETEEIMQAELENGTKAPGTINEKFVQESEKMALTIDSLNNAAHID